MKIKAGVIDTLPSVVNDIAFSTRFRIVFSFQGSDYTYRRVNDYLEFDRGSNTTILRAVYGTDFRAEVAKIYGYKSEGAWPTWDSITELKRLLLDMESKGVIITLP